MDKIDIELNRCVPCRHCGNKPTYRLVSGELVEILCECKADNCFGLWGLDRDSRDIAYMRKSWNRAQRLTDYWPANTDKLYWKAMREAE